MIKTIFFLLFLLVLEKNTFAQKYFKIEGTKRIFTYYEKKRNTKINDSTCFFYYLKNNNFYIAVKTSNTSLRPYVKYNIMKKKEKSKISSIGRGSSEITRVRIIDVSLVKAEKKNVDSQIIEEILKSSSLSK